MIAAWLYPLVGLVGCGSPPTPPNVLIVTLDTTRADHLGCYGHARRATPELDRLANEGARFTRAYTVTPLTIPAHSSLHTGLFPPRHGVRDNGDFLLGPEAVTLAERLRERGYQTMAAVGAEVTSHHWGFQQGFDAYFDDMGPSADPSQRWRVERPGDAVVADARAWLDARDRARPFFAWVHLFDAHAPYEPPEPWASRFASDPYLGEIARVDALVGDLLALLRRDGTLDTTWVVVLADHGEGLGTHGETTHGVLLYDATTRIPLIVRPPKGRAAVAIGAPVSIVDIAPTVLAAAGAPPCDGCDGHDLGPLLSGGDAPDRDVYVESLYAWHHYGWAPQRALVDAAWKLIDSTTPELYAAGDPDEQHDRASAEPTTLAGLRARLAALDAGFAPSGAAAPASDDAMSQLAALGYVTTVDAAPTAGILEDPVRKLPSLRRLEQARAAMRGDPAAALPVLEALVAAEPGLVEPHLMEAGLLLRLGRPEDALARLEAFEATNPSSQVAGLRGTVLLRLGRGDEAFAAWEAAIEKDPYQAIHWAAYLPALYAHGDAARFARAVDRASVLLPDAPSVRAMRGVRFAAEGDRAAAKPLLERALADDADLPFVREALAGIARNEGRVIDAEASYLDEIAVFPPALRARKALVEMYVGQGRTEEQLAQLDAMLPFAPTAEVRHSRGQALYNLGRLAAADDELKRCRDDFPAYAGCPMVHANVLKKLGRPGEAEAAYHEALRLAGP